MRPYTVFVDVVDQQAGIYQISIKLSALQDASPMETKRYLSEEALRLDLKEHLRLPDAAIDHFFSDPRHELYEINFPLSDEDAAYFGWDNSRG